MPNGFGSGAHAAAPRSCQNCRFTESPIDALIGLVVRRGLCHQVSIRLALHPVIHLRVTALPQRRPACRADMRGVRVHSDVVKNMLDITAVEDAMKRLQSVGVAVATPR